MSNQTQSLQSGNQGNVNLSLSDSNPRLELTRAMRALRPKLRSFVRALVHDPSRNGLEAYRSTVGPNASPEAAKVQASRYRARQDVQRAIHALETVICDKMSREEVLTSYARVARADLTDLIGEDGEFDLELARKRRILKKAKHKRYRDKDDNEVNEVEFEIHDPLKALGEIVKIQGYAAPTQVEIGLSPLERAIRAADEAEKRALIVEAEVVKVDP